MIELKALRLPVKGVDSVFIAQKAQQTTNQRNGLKKARKPKWQMLSS